MTTIVKTINPANKAVEQIKVSGTAAPINVAPGAIVEVQAGRAQVASFIQNGKNLVLVMVDGTEIVLQGYFDNVEGAAKKLILVDENGSVEVQFPTADGSVADDASIDVAPSYAAVDAATTTSLAEAGSQDASVSGISPVLMGVLGAIGVGALAAGGGGGGDSAAPAAKTEQQLDPQIDSGKEEGKEDVNEGVQSAADLVALIKMLSAAILVSKDDARTGTSDLFNLQKDLLGLRPAIAAKIAELDQSDTADDQQIKEELQILGGMLNRFSSALKEANLGETMDESMALRNVKEDELDTREAYLDKFVKTTLEDVGLEATCSDLESAFASIKASLKEKIAAIEDNDLRENLSILIASANDDEDSVSTLRDAVDSAVDSVWETTGPFAGADEIAETIEALEVVAHDIETQKELMEDIRVAKQEFDAAVKQYNDSRETMKELEAKSYEALSPIALLSEIDAMHDVQDELGSGIEQAQLLGQAAIDDATEIAKELEEAKIAQQTASDEFYATTGFLGLGSRGDAAKLAARDLANERLERAIERDVQVKESIALAKEVADDANNSIKLISEQIAQKEAVLHDKSTVEEDSHKIVESQPELPAKIVGEIAQLEQTLTDMKAAGLKAKDLLQNALDDAEQPAAELKEAKDAFDIVAAHETRASSKLFQPAEERLNIAEVADALAKETVSEAQHIANEIENSIKAMNEEVVQKYAEFQVSAKFYDALDTNLDTNDQSNKVEANTDGAIASKAELSLSDLAKDLFSENTDSSVPSPSTGSDYDAPAALQDSFADQPQLIVQ